MVAAADSARLTAAVAPRVAVWNPAHRVLARCSALLGNR
jgi:hypothetical protein